MYRFTITGHKNILATHKTTLEFTKDDEVTQQGDCIVGVRAAFDHMALAKELAYPKIRVTISSGKNHFVFYATPNKQFTSDHELVFRKTAFLSPRTIGTWATRAASDIPLLLRYALQQGVTCTVSVEGVPLKYIFFDFDDTLCDFLSARTVCHEKIAQTLEKKYHLPKQKSIILLDAIDAQFPKKASATNDVRFFDRHMWFSWLFEKSGKKLPQRECNELVKEYWSCMIRNTKPLPHALDVLGNMGKKYKLGLLTDADGKKEYKKKRIACAGMANSFDICVLGDELGVVKPHPKMFHALLRAFHAQPNECVVVGDKPWADLLPAKDLGMMTIWMKYGIYAHQVKETPVYVDYAVTDLCQLLEIL